MIVNARNLRTVNTGFKTAFNKAFGEAKPQWQRVAMPSPSEDEAETYEWLGASTAFREWVGSRVLQNLKKHGYSIKNRPFENTVVVPKTKIADDRYGVYTPLMAQLGQDAAMHPDLLVFGLLARGFNTRCYDGQPFFDPDHPVVNADGVEESVSNVQAGDGPAWFLLDVSKVLKPLIFQEREKYEFRAMDTETDEQVFMNAEFRYGSDGRGNAGFGLWQMAYASRQPLTATNYEAARAAMMSFRRDGGNPWGIMPGLLVVPPTLESDAKRVVVRDVDANGATNTNKGTADVLATPWLF